MKNFLKKPNRGFTLVEVLVSLALFTIIVVAAVGSLYSVNEASVKVGAMRTVLDNLSFATESMSRTIRTGQNIICGGTGSHIGGPNCAFGTTTGSGEIALDSTLGTKQTLDYRFIPGSSTTPGSIQRCNVNGNSASGSVNFGSCVAITAPEVDIQKMTFFVDGADPTDNKQPGVMMLIQGVAHGGVNNTSPFAVQTYISQLAGE